MVVAYHIALVNQWGGLNPLSNDGYYTSFNSPECRYYCRFSHFKGLCYPWGGDDICIYNKAVALQYIKDMQKLGVLRLEISINKSIISGPRGYNENSTIRTA